MKVCQAGRVKCFRRLWNKIKIHSGFFRSNINNLIIYVFKSTASVNGFTYMWIFVCMSNASIYIFGLTDKPTLCIYSTSVWYIHLTCHVFFSNIMEVIWNFIYLFFLVTAEYLVTTLVCEYCCFQFFSFLLPVLNIDLGCCFF